MDAINTLLPIGSLTPQSQSFFPGTAGHSELPLIIPSQATTGPSSGLQKAETSVWHLADAKSQALVVRDTSADLAWTSMETWQLTKALPFMQMEDHYVKVQVFEAMPCFLSLTPEETLGHTMTQRMTEQTVALARLSLQAKIVPEFVRTPIGRTRFLAIIRQFATSMRESAHAEVYRALISAHDGAHAWLSRHGTFPRDELKRFLEWDRAVFGSLNKDERSLAMRYAEIKAMMGKIGGRADMVILPEGASVYARFKPENVEFYRAGPDGPKALKGQPTAGNSKERLNPYDRADPVTILADADVYVARSMLVEGRGPVDPLVRVRQIGGYNILPTLGSQTAYSPEDYTSQCRSILIYNCDADSMSAITLTYCLRHCNLFDDNGKAKVIPDDGSGDIRYDPFQMRGSDYKPIEYMGDIYNEHFSIDSLRKLVGTLRKAKKGADDQTFFTRIAPKGDNLFAKNFGRASATGKEEGALEMVRGQVRPGAVLIGALATTLRNALSVPGGKAFGAVGESAEALRDEAMEHIRKLQAEDYEKMTLKNAEHLKMYVNKSFREYAEAAAASQGKEPLVAPSSSSSSVGASSSSFPRSIEDFAWARELFAVQDTRSAAPTARQSRPTAGYSDAGGLGLSAMAPVGLAYDGSAQEEMEERRNVETTEAAEALGVSGPEARKRLGNIDDMLRRIYESGMTEEDKWLGVFYLGIPFNRQNLEAMVANNVEIPINFIIARPHQTWRTRCMIAMQSGGGAGYLYSADTDVQIGHDAKTKTSIINLTTYMLGHVHQPKNVFVAHDIFVEQYIGGFGVKPFDAATYSATTLDTTGASIMVFPTAYEDNINTVEEVISVTGKMPVKYNTPHTDYPQYAGAARAIATWKFNQIVDGGIPYMPLFDPSIPEPVNIFMWRGHQQEWDPQTKSHRRIRVNTGHMGTNIYQGVRRVWEGTDYIKSAEYATTYY